MTGQPSIPSATPTAKPTFDDLMATARTLQALQIAVLVTSDRESDELLEDPSDHTHLQSGPDPLQTVGDLRERMLSFIEENAWDLTHSIDAGLVNGPDVIQLSTQYGGSAYFAALTAKPEGKALMDMSMGGPFTSSVATTSHTSVPEL